MVKSGAFWRQLSRVGFQNVPRKYSSSSHVGDRVALITGGAQGLGRGFAEALLDKGTKVCISDVNVSQGKQTEAELQDKYGTGHVFFQPCDVTSESEVEDMLEGAQDRFGHLDILVNNAGIINETNWRLMMDINLTAVLQTTTSALKYMGKAAGRSNGLIVNVSSVAGVLAIPFAPGYAAVKHGVLGYSRSLGVVSPKMYGVRVNALCPSFTYTDILTPKEGTFTSKETFDIGNKMMKELGIMKPPQVTEAFMELVANEKLSGAALLVSLQGTGVLRMPKTVEEAFDMYS